MMLRTYYDGPALIVSVYIDIDRICCAVGMCMYLYILWRIMVCVNNILCLLVGRRVFR